MHSDLVTQAAMTALRCVVVLVSHRSLMKSFAAYILLFTSIIIMQPISAGAGDSSNISKSPEQLMNRLKERLRLTEEQESKIQPIIDGSFKKGREMGADGIATFYFNTQRLA